MGDTIIKTTIRVPSKVWDRAKIRAIQDHVSVQELVVAALQSYLKGGAQ
jgi:predicted HicB family RNase H-like nuclease